MPSLYFEDFTVGSKRDLGSHLVTEEEILAFARQYDPQPFHVDKDAARNSIYKGLISSGWMTCSIMMRLLVDNMTSKSASMGSPGVDEIRWLKPVYAGDTIQVKLTCKQKTAKETPPDGVPQGVVAWDVNVSNQEQELVATYTILTLVKRK